MLRLGQVEVYEIKKWYCGKEDGSDIGERKIGKLQIWEGVELM